MSSLRRLLLVALALVSWSAHAVEDPDTEIARRHFAAGAQLYDDARYEQAIVEFEAARAVHAAPAFDYNIARCYDRLERVPDAITWYERYLEHAPASDETTQVRARLEVLRARVPVVVAPVVVVSHEPRRTDLRRHHYSVAVPATFAALSVASVVVGGALYGVSGTRYDDLGNQGCGTRLACTSSMWDTTRTMERAGIGLMIAGGVIAAVDVGLWAGWRAR